MTEGLKKIRVLGHPMHAPLTHFPLALWTVAFLGDLAFLFLKDPFWWRFTFWSIALGLGIGCLTLLTGFVDYIFIPADRKDAERTANYHMMVMLLVASVFGASLYFHRGAGPVDGSQGTTALVLSSAGFFLLQLGGWLGGHLVYHHGIGYDGPNPPTTRS